jgi:hypothetical protein
MEASNEKLGLNELAQGNLSISPDLLVITGEDGRSPFVWFVGNKPLEVSHVSGKVGVNSLLQASGLGLGSWSILFLQNTLLE